MEHLVAWMRFLVAVGAGAAAAAAVAVVIRMRMAADGEPAIEAHQASEVEKNMAELRACASNVRAHLGNKTIKCTAVPHDAPVPVGSTKVHFIRHGEGFHNEAQRVWRADPSWNGKTEPYTMDTDPSWRFVDAELNDKGLDQARALQKLTEPALKPELLVVSPMRRATLTGLMAFEPHIARHALPVLANELCHERAGRHTCDKRLSRTNLAALYPVVDYSLVTDEEDPYWGDGWTREPWADLGLRAGRFANWLLARPEREVAVAAHSAFVSCTLQHHRPILRPVNAYTHAC